MSGRFAEKSSEQNMLSHHMRGIIRQIDIDQLAITVRYHLIVCPNCEFVHDAYFILITVHLISIFIFNSTQRTSFSLTNSAFLSCDSYL